MVDASLRNARRKVIREHIRQESTQDLDGLLAGMTKDCICAVNISPKPFVGPKAVADRYLQQWRAFPDFKVRVRRIVAEGQNYVVTENEWRGTHAGRSSGSRRPERRRGCAHASCGYSAAAAFVRKRSTATLRMCFRRSAY
jgi:hypothetical protein